MNVTSLRGYCAFISVVISLFTTSCVNTRKATYFNDLGDGTITANTPVPENVIRKNDILSISVSSLNPEATEIFNTPNTSGTVMGGNVISGYLVSPEGTIDFPILGRIMAQGLTKDKLKESITQTLVNRKLLTDPIVSIRFLNFRVTVLGEVKNPTVLHIPNEKISLLEAIGLAGDLTIYSKRDNILVIREENGVKILKRLNLNSTELLSSPYYYLKSEDVVYVEPNRARIATAGRGSQWVPIVFSALSFAAILVDRISANNR
jgi:polysaccharide export outer membrane protein